MKSAALARKHSGFSILELLIVLSVSAILLSLAMRGLAAYRANDDMASLGGEIATVANAVTSYVFDQGSLVPVGPVVYNGVDWLRDSTCGGPVGVPAGQGYLSCNFRADIAPRYGLGYQTTVNRNVAANNTVTASTLMVGGTVNYKGEDRIDLAGKALKIAKGRYANASTKAISDATLDLYIDYQFDPQNGQMVVVVDNASDGSDPWLSITGQNEMQADLDVGDGTFDVVDANNVFWGGTPTLAEDANNTQSALTTTAAGSAAIRLNGRGNAGSEIVFIRDGTEVVFNVRIANQADGELLLEADQGVVVDSPIVDLIGGSGNNQMVADDFYSKSTNRSLKQAVTDVFMANHDQLIPKPVCGAGLNPTIYTAVSRFAGVDTSDPNNLSNIAAFQGRAINNGSTWRIQLDGYVQDKGYIVPPADLAAVMVVTKCS